MKNFFQEMQNGVMVFDGGVGSYLYEKGVYINTCFDQLNLFQPDLVQEVHRDYVEAGADIIETNTFGANRLKLSAYGVGDKVREVNFKGAQIAKKVAGEKIFVAGSVGPLGIEIEPWGKLSYSEAKDFFKEQVQGLLEGGVDLLVLETFSRTSELLQAIQAVRECHETIPLIVQVSVGDDFNLLAGETLENFVKEVTPRSIQALGMNCSLGPKMMLEALEKLRPLTSLPISVQPNAGLPQEVEGRKMYMASPEYMAEYAKRFIQSGATFVGGCCGTNPKHIQAIRRAVKALHPGQSEKFHSVESSFQTPLNVHPYDKLEKSRLSNKLQRKQFVTLVEVVSPRGISPEKELTKTKQLFHFGIDAINIPDGPRASARMSALALATLIQKEVGVETILHMACRDRNIIGMQSDLLGAWALGVKNVLAITGDPPKLGKYPNATAVFDVDSIGLCNVISRLNHGLDLAENPIGEPTGFCYGVGVNPGAVNLDEELRRLDWKIQAGAEFMITQPVFDLSIFERFLQRVSQVSVPLICGIWPLLSYRNAEFMNNEVPGATVPQEILDRMKKVKTQEEGFEEGIRIAQETFQQVRSVVAGVQLSAPMGRVEGVFRIVGDSKT